MATLPMQRVYRLLTQARERGWMPWPWIVDETRELEKVSTWSDPEEYVRAVSRSYRRDFWQQQPVRVLVASENGTVRGVIRPITDEYGIGFLPVHGFSSATAVRDLAQDDDPRPLVILYVGDFDPSGMFMSDKDLPARLEKYGGYRVSIRRLAILADDVAALPTFPASD
jgi:hypothetical protein